MHLDCAGCLRAVEVDEYSSLNIVLVCNWTVNFISVHS